MLAYCCLYVRWATVKASRLVETSPKGGFVRVRGSEGASLQGRVSRGLEGWYMGIERRGVSVLAAAVEDMVSVGTVIATGRKSLMEGQSRVYHLQIFVNIYAVLLG